MPTEAYNRVQQHLAKLGWNYTLAPASQKVPSVTVAIQLRCQKHNRKYHIVPSRFLHAENKSMGCPSCNSEVRSAARAGEKRGPVPALRGDPKEFARLVQQKFKGNVILRSDYITNTDDIDCECSVCGHAWTTTPVNLKQSKVGCPECGKRQAHSKTRKTLAQFKRELKRATGGYVALTGRYENDNTKTEFHCNRCNKPFTLRPNTVLQYPRNGCGKCHSFTVAANGSLHRIGAAAFSQAALRWLDEVSQTEDVEIQHATNGGERSLLLPNGQRVVCDGFCEATNTIYEYHGDKWHGNPFTLAPNSTPHPHRKDVTARELYQETHMRMLRLSLAGYRVVWVWERDYLTHGKLVSGILDGRIPD